MLLSSGLHTAPCGVPCTGVHSSSPSSTPCSRNASTRPRMRPSDTFCPTRARSRSLGIVSKSLFRSASTTWMKPALSNASTRRSACLQPRPRRKPPACAGAGSAVGGEIPLEDRLQHRSQGRLHHPVLHRRYPQWTLLRAPRLGDVVPSNALRPVAPGAQRFAQPPQIGVQIARVLRDRDMIHPSPHGWPPLA